ncbi:MAG: nucleotidyl transferase AbiEii/AbiGii toxin family protein [Symploca sp. SIO3E6]|nr:nucleotidyl transferase AbiEii/AbiGii toxin family protein [Caldora sp. SIO3E6]
MLDKDCSYSCHPVRFLRERDDVVVFGAQAVNAYVSEPRMTQDIDLMSIRASELVEELREYLRGRFYIAARVREVKEGQGYRLYQVQKSGNRHLIGVRQVGNLPLAQRIEQVLVMAPAELIASKVISYYQRRGKPKSGTDWRDLTMLLLTFPELKQESSEVLSCLRVAGSNEKILELWREIVEMEIQQEDDDEY